jgi:23S rRNA (adenine2030-N6)-methyltransferase
MNYRHAFHAGNFADCLKHAVLVWLLHALRRKPGGFFVLDTHAGPGRTELMSGPAARTGEWRRGIARLLDDPPEPLADYVALVQRLGLYPGSPALAAALLRPDDRLVACELQPEDHAALRRLFRDEPRVAVHRRDGWEALGALLPPQQRRGLVLVDPPYEETDELVRLAAGLRTGHRRFGAGVFAAWYPIKHRAPVRAFHNAMGNSGIRDIVAAELWLREPIDPARLNGCGMLVINPPYRFQDELTPVLAALVARLGDGEPGARTALTRLADE